MTGVSRAWVGPACAILGVFGFSFKAILVKLGYAAHAVEPITLLTLRMIYSLPFFAAMAWWAGRHPGNAAPISRRDWLALIYLGFVGYYFSSYMDFLGLLYVTAALERLILYLYPTMVVVLSILFFKKPVTRRIVASLAMSYAGILLVFVGDLRVSDNIHDLLVGSLLVLIGTLCYALYLVGAGPVIMRLGSLRFIAWAMMLSSAFIFVHFLATEPLGALAVPARVHIVSALMAVVSTVLPTYLMAEAIKRLGASRASLVGSLGPVFTIGLGVWILKEPVFLIQVVGAGLVLMGVALVTFERKPAKPRAA